MLVSEILKKKGDNVVTTSPSTSVVCIARLFKSLGIGSVVVLGETGAMVGLVTEKNIMHHLAADIGAPLNRPISEIMTTAVTTCVPNDNIRQIMEWMTRLRIRHIPVVSEGRLRGIISIGDVVKYRLEQSSLEINVLRDVARAHTLARPAGSGGPQPGAMSVDRPKKILT